MLRLGARATDTSVTTGASQSLETLDERTFGGWYDWSGVSALLYGNPGSNGGSGSTGAQGSSAAFLYLSARVF
jgi:hypothetical protein